jgi:hypothetical protein
MSRIAFLARHPRRSLTALATLVAAGAVVVGSGAVFSTQTANPSNTFASGILKQTNSQSAAILTAANLIPGSATHNQASGTVDIANTGTVPGTFTLTRSALVDKNSADGTTASTARSSNLLSGALQVKIWDCGDASAPSCPADGDTASTIYNDVLSAFPAAGISLGEYAVNESHQYRFLVYLPDNLTPAAPLTADSTTGTTGDNRYSGAFTSATFNWTSVTS